MMAVGDLCAAIDASGDYVRPVFGGAEKLTKSVDLLPLDWIALEVPEWIRPDISNRVAYQRCVVYLCVPSCEGARTACGDLRFTARGWGSPPSEHHPTAGSPRGPCGGWLFGGMEVACFRRRSGDQRRRCDRSGLARSTATACSRCFALGAHRNARGGR